MLTKTIVYIWNDENHSTWQDAKAHGVCDHVELDRIHPTTHLEHIKGMVNLFNRRTDKLSITLKFEVVELTSFSVGCQVLEWNEYSVECWATSKEDAVARVKDEAQSPLIN